MKTNLKILLCLSLSIYFSVSNNGQLSGRYIRVDDEQWKADVDRIAKDHSDLNYEDLSRKISEELAHSYPDVTWVAITYKDVTGYDKHTMTEDGPDIHSRFRYYGKNVVVARFTTARNPDDTGLGDKLNNAWEHGCRKYCQDPACWSSYWLVDAERTWHNTHDNLSVDKHMLFVLQMTFMGSWASRQDTDDGRTYSDQIAWGRSTNDQWPMDMLTVSWDTRVVTRIFRTSDCRDGYVLLMSP